ncbi:sigma-54-dependent Fis family transcriptional regulator [Acetobacterium sp.]|uniref:sigma-54-dependent Fis family transcriptional regulator n=1 Tax=Acetobacterium sp. TaxID=1872094 RepID=UPI002F41782A
MDLCDIMRQKFYKEWEIFSRTGECDSNVIRPIILESWKRCRNQGIDPLDSKNYFIEDPQRFDKILRANNYLIALAKPYMEILGKIVDETGFMGILASKEGYVLNTIGDPELVKSAEVEFIKPGSIRTENVSGTTGIAICLINKQPVQIFSSEHYCSFYHNWTCCAAPIFGELGELVGVLNLSGDYRFIHKHTLGIVIALAKAIEDAIKLSSINTYLHNCIDSSENGMAVLDTKNNVKHLNKNLKQYSTPSENELLEKPVSEVLISEPPLIELLEKDNKFFEKSIVIKNKNKYTTLLVNTQSVYTEENELIGKLIVTKEKKEVHNLINRMVGAYATFTFDDILGKNEKLLSTIELAKSVASTDARVLIQGESGTGKELFAQAIHNMSDLRDGPFIGINCSAIPSELMESELFGYNDGAFSGARKGGMPGKFELADGGTIFLDEINSMPHFMQIKLLRVLEENKIVRVGGNVVLPINVRIIAASGENLGELVEQGRMRLDLYYRINTFILDVPPLRQRKDDIPLLAKHFVDMICCKIGMEVKELSEDFISALMKYEWPGNIRELGNVLERAIIISQDDTILTANHLDTTSFKVYSRSFEPVVDCEKTPPDVKTLRQIEKETIIEVLKLTNNNRALTAKLLDIHRNTLRNKLKEYQI